MATRRLASTPNPHSAPPRPHTAIRGLYTITASGAADPDYTISYVGGTLTVSPATLTVTANDQTRPQGEANPPLTYTLSGLVNGDTASVVSGRPHPLHDRHHRQPRRPVPHRHHRRHLERRQLRLHHRRRHIDHRQYPGHYDHADGQPRLRPRPTARPSPSRPPSARPSAATRRRPAPSSSKSMAFPSAWPSRWSTASATSDLLSSPNVGSHAIEAIYSGDSFYDTNSQTVTQTVTPAMLTITADNQTKVYGAALPTLTASYYRVRQRRHLRQLDAPSPRSARPPPRTAHDRRLCHHRERRGGFGLHRSRMRLGNLTVTSCAVDDHRRQPDQGLRRGICRP